MPTLTDLTAIVEKLALGVSELNLDGDEQEEYSTMLVRLQNQVETGEPSESIVKECLAYFAKFASWAPRWQNGFELRVDIRRAS